MKTIGKRLLMAALVLVVAAGMLMPAGAAQAANVKKIKAVRNMNKAKAVKKGKTYCVTAGEYDGGFYYLKFKVPKTKTYKFTFSGLAIHGEDTAECTIYGSTAVWGYDEFDFFCGYTVDFSEGGTGETFWLCSEQAEENSVPDKSVPTASLQKRTGAVKLKKGDTVYVVFNFTELCDVMLKIK